MTLLVYGAVMTAATASWGKRRSAAAFSARQAHHHRRCGIVAFHDCTGLSETENRMTSAGRAKRWAADRVGSLAGTSLGEMIRSKASALDRLLDNDSDDSTRNGESWLLEQLAPLNPTVILDVGAHRGDWSNLALESLPSGSIHAFEPVPLTYRQLQERFGTVGRVTTVNEALSRPGCAELTMWTTGPGDTMASVAGSERPGTAAVTVRCTAGDDYLERLEIGHVDLLKIDVEGHEMEVLEGFRSSLRNGRIDVVQFEFTLWSALAQRWLADYYRFMEPHGYRIGKLMPRGVEWRRYRPEHERFLRFNYVAARRGSRAYSALGAPHEADPQS